MGVHLSSCGINGDSYQPPPPQLLCASMSATATHTHTMASHYTSNKMLLNDLPSFIYAGIQSVCCNTGYTPLLS